MAEHADDQLLRIRHSASHVMAQAVLEMFPDAKLAIGPAIEDGFYYDFDLPRPLTPEDLAQIEERMKEILRGKHPFERQEIDRAQAMEMFADQPYKLELIAELPEGEPISIYRHDTFVDLCRGPHVAHTGEIRPNAVKIMSAAGAYWRGDEHNPMLQRVYGTAWHNRVDLDAYLKRLAEIEARDHRKLIRDLDLVSFQEEVGAGLALWHPKGGRMRVLIEDYWRKLHYEGGYDIVFTPHIGRANLWETSGHLDFYRDGMYSPMDIEGQEYYIKPMNCPFQIMIYKSQTRSYRDLPLRWAELGTVYRYERSGTLHGLLRVRGFTQDDAHVICTPEQIDAEILRVLDFSLNLLRGFGFEQFRFDLSVRDPANLGKYAGEDAMWVQAEASLAKALEARSLPYQRMEGEAVFYGPKIDIHIQDALGRTWQCTTIQFDFNLPGRFDMTYIGEDGEAHRPYMVHRALLGSLERFFALLVEHYAGAFPVWLMPVQAVVIPIADRHNAYAEQVLSQLEDAGIRAEANLSGDRMNAKIRDAQMLKIPYMLVVGDREMEAEQVNLRLRDGSTPGAIDVAAFVALVQGAIAERRVL
ncbi:MAG: threonine--tRNA ligase [Anaerolineae bacterium]|nr:threonine--tRNA ligase [Anaerolineae bacterium]